VGAPVLVEQVAGDAEQPGAESASRRVEPPQMAQRLLENRRGQVFGVLRVLDPVVHVVAHPGEVQVVKSQERLGVAIEPSNERLLAWKGLFVRDQSYTCWQLSSPALPGRILNPTTWVFLQLIGRSGQSITANQ